MVIKIIKNSLLNLCGWIFVALGVIGIFLPIMPTTIFLILAAGCFARSSEKFYSWMINHKKFGPLIKNYLENRGMPRRAKIIAIAMLNVSIGSSILFFTDSLYVKIILLGIALGVTIYLLSLKTVPNIVQS
ncbi:MAG: YbaN family protein [Melioribacteraceae bacterium]|nr:YbaN family protein [Melioribacteraceae bacterium]